MKGLLTAAAAAAVSLAFVGGAYAADPIKIGFSLPKTGIYAPAAPSQEQAYDLWRDQVNAAGGIEVAGGGKRLVQFVQYDDQSDPAQAAKIYEKLIVEDKVDLLLGPWGTPHHIAVAGVLERHKFPMVGDTAASVILRSMKPGYIWFPTSALPDEMGKQLPLLLKSQGVKTVAVTTAQYIFSLENKKYMMEGLKAAGIQVVAEADYPVDIKDMTAVITKVKAANPDAEISLSMPGDSVLYTKQSAELGLHPKVQFMLVGPTASFFTHIFGDKLEGLITMGHWSPSLNAKAKAFYDAYEAKYKDAPDYLDSSLSYESCEILQAAVAKVGLDHEKLKTEFATDTFDTIDGPVKFNGVVNATTPTMFLQYQKDQYQIVWPEKAATAKLEMK
ncbi:MAG TPA: amino acid ABC transporter substrate-binding protein [Magnetospirillaceae bacterium]